MNLSVINCRTFRRTSKQYQNLIHCKQTQNERKGHSRKYPHRPVQIWACHTQTVEVHVSRFHYAASREPEPSFFRTAFPATAFRYQSLQRAGERTSLLLGIYNMPKNSPTESFFQKFFIFFFFSFQAGLRPPNQTNISIQPANAIVSGIFVCRIFFAAWRAIRAVSGLMHQQRYQILYRHQP